MCHRDYSLCDVHVTAISPPTLQKNPFGGPNRSFGDQNGVLEQPEGHQGAPGSHDSRKGSQKGFFGSTWGHQWEPKVEQKGIHKQPTKKTFSKVTLEILAIGAIFLPAAEDSFQAEEAGAKAADAIRE